MLEGFVAVEQEEGRKGDKGLGMGGMRTGVIVGANRGGGC